MNELIHFLTRHGTAALFMAVPAELAGLPIHAVPFLIASGEPAGTGLSRPLGGPAKSLATAANMRVFGSAEFDESRAASIHFCCHI